MGKIKSKIREDLMKEIEQKKDLLEFHTMIVEEIEISDIILKFNQLIYLKIDISTQLFNNFVRLLNKKKYYDDNVVINCEKFIIDNYLVSSNMCDYLVEAYSSKGIFTEYTMDAVDIILTYCKEVNIINKIKIGFGLKNIRIDKAFIEAFVNYYSVAKHDLFMVESVKQICNNLYIIPVELIDICYEVYLESLLKEYNVLEKILFSALMKDAIIFKEIVYKCGDDYIDYCNERNEYSKERTMILLEMYKEHKVCSIDMLVEFLKYEMVDKNDELVGVFDNSGKEIVSMYQKNKKMYYKVGFCNSFMVRYENEDKVVDREILNIYFNSVIIKLYRTSNDIELKRFCCERYIDENLFNEKLLKDYISMGSNKSEYLLSAYEILLERYFENLSSNYDEAKIYVNKYIEIVQRMDGGLYKDYVKNHIISLIENNDLNEAKNILTIIERRFLKDYMNIITSILFKSIESKRLNGLMEIFDILLFIDSSQSELKSIQGLFVKYLSNIKLINKKYNEMILAFYKESSDANKREILNLILGSQVENITLLLSLYELKESTRLEKILIDKFNNEEIIYPVEVQKKLIYKNKHSLDIILKLSKSVSEEVHEEIYNITKEYYSKEHKEIITGILKNILKYEKARLAWLKLNQPIIDIYSLGEIKVSNKYLQMRIGENIFSSDRVLVIKLERDYREKLEKYIINEDVYLKNIGDYYILDYIDITNELVNMDIGDILTIFQKVINIYEEWKKENIYLYNPEIDKFIISRQMLFPLYNLIIRVEGHILSSKDVNNIVNKIGKTITRKDVYEEAVSCNVYIKFFSYLLEHWIQLKLLDNGIDDILYKKINFICENLFQVDSIITFNDIKIIISKIKKIIINKDIDALTTKEKIDNFYMFKGEYKDKIFNYIIENNITNEEAIEIIINNINDNCVSKKSLEYLVDAFKSRIYDENEIKNILLVLNIIESYSNKITWDEELDQTIENFLDNILKNKKIYNIVIKNAI